MKTGERDYSKGKIYKLVSDVNDEFYIGSTATSLAKRKYWHKTKGRQMPGVKAIFDEIGWDEMKIILVEEWPCENNDQLRQRERYWFDALKPTMNIRRPWVTEEERKETNRKLARERYQRPEVKQRQRERMHEWYENNKERYQRPEVKQRQREYEQRPEVKQRKREYNNRPDQVQQIQCPCGSTVQQRCLQRHERSRKHQRWQAAQQEEEQKDD